MKRYFWACCALLLLSCAKEMDHPEVLEIPAREEVKTYTLTVTAGKGEQPDTKALGFDGTALIATWTKGDTVRVYKGIAFLGTLFAQADGPSTTLSGSVSGDLAKDDVLTLKFKSPDYTSQDGTLTGNATSIDQVCDYADANVTVTNVDETTVTTTSAIFENRQAIVKFMLNVSAKPLSITLPGSCIAVTPASAQNVLYVALPALSSQPISFMAAADEKVYAKNVTSLTLEAGKYYAITLTLTESASDLLVHNEAELRAAVQKNNAQILFANDIATTGLLEIRDSRTVTINLGGYKLDRGCKSRGSQAIVVRTGSTLNLSGGTVTGGWGGNGGALDIENGATVNLLNVMIIGNSADDRGGGICNREGGTLNMTGGAITGNTSYDHTSPSGGGGLFNYEGATATLTNVTITGNAVRIWGGGGICNYGTINLDGCTITGNSAMFTGGGIWSGNEKHLLRMKGANIITDNTAGGVPSNLYMLERRWITITGSITGSRIGISLDVAPNQFTDGYATYHNGVDPHTFFTCDRPETDDLILIPDEQFVHYIGEVKVIKKNIEGTVPYIEHSWDDVNKKVLTTTKVLTELIDADVTPTSETQYKKLPSSDTYLNLGTKNSTLNEYYVVDNVEVKGTTLYVVGPNVHIILCDKAWLHLSFSINVDEGHTVYIHSQSAGSDMGKMTNDDGSSDGGIGGNEGTNGGNIEIHGGNFNLRGNNRCAAIGGQFHINGNITIYDGRITVLGGICAAGIGGGGGCENYGNITIYNGTIDAIGGDRAFAVPSGGAGIGGGKECLNGNLTIWGGSITSRGDGNSAGIGSAQIGGDYGAGTITINGGYVKAYGDAYGAGIGGGDGKRGGTLIVNGGRVEAYGGTDAAGIGGGEGGNGGIVTINGGYVFAQGGADYGAGIGGGEEGTGANVTINGGTVVVKSGTLGATGMRGIGPGYGNNNYGSLTLADKMMVRSWNGDEGPYPAALRKDYCWYRTQARIEPCTHPGYTAATCPYCIHE